MAGETWCGVGLAGAVQDQKTVEVYTPGVCGGLGGGDRGKLEFVLHSWWEVMRNNVIRS